MSEMPQADPDLHAIFGIDGASEQDDGGHSISVASQGERAGRGEVELELEDRALPGVSEHIELADDLHVELDPREDSGGEVGLGRIAEDIDGGSFAPEEPSETAARTTSAEGYTGITKPSRRGSSQRFITDVIVDMGLATRRQVDDALESSRISGTTPERALLESGAISQDALARALAERYGLDHLDLGVFSVDMSAANLVSTTIAKRYQTVPVAFADKRTLLVAMADPSNVLAVDDIAIMTGYEIRVAVAPPDDIAALISRLDRLEDVVGESAETLEEGSEDG